MEVLYLLIPLAVLLAGVIVWAFFWSVKSGQFDDLEGPAHRILMDDDKPTGKPQYRDVLPVVPKDAKKPDSPDKSAAQGGAGGGAEGRQTAAQEKWCRDAPSTEPRMQGAVCGAEGRKSPDGD